MFQQNDELIKYMERIYLLIKSGKREEAEFDLRRLFFVSCATNILNREQLIAIIHAAETLTEQAIDEFKSYGSVVDVHQRYAAEHNNEDK